MAYNLTFLWHNRSCSGIMALISTDTITGETLLVMLYDAEAD